MNHDPVTYYARRAPHYDDLYAKPERQAELTILGNHLQTLFAGQNVLEVACGTGYWTQHIAQTANFILATDLAGEPMEVARNKNLPDEKVRFAIADAFDLPATTGPFNGAYAGFWWSHLRHSECRPFLQSLRRCLSPGATVVLMDNRYVEGSSTPVSRTDDEGNTWQARTLPSGEAHDVLKNFPTESDLVREVEGFGVNCRYTALQYYWLFAFDAR